MRFSIPLVVALAHTAIAALSHVSKNGPRPLDASAVKDVNVAGILGLGKRELIQVATFEQLMDHKNPSSANSPNDTTTIPSSTKDAAVPSFYSVLGRRPPMDTLGLFAQSIGAGTVLLEHRYWGESSPYSDLTVENLQHLTLENSVADLVYFAQNVRLPFDPKGTSSPSNAPWVLSGCSYSGALSAWVNALAPGTFWAYHGSSAVVEAIYDFWGYYDTVEQAMPRNCSSDVKKATKYIDQVLGSGDADAKSALKKKFGLATVEYDDDFVSAITSGLGDWQGVGFSDPTNPFNQFCDYIENQWPNSNATAPGAEGVGLNKALDGWAKWTFEVMLPFKCSATGFWTSPFETACLDTHNATNPLYTDVSVDNQAGRQWMWMLCNEPFGWWNGYDKARSGNIVPSLLNTAYYQSQCDIYFPKENGFTYRSALGRTETDTNKWTKGWSNTNTTRFLWVNGELDPWRLATISSEERLGGPVQDSKQVPVKVVPKAAHCSDMIAANALANDDLLAILEEELQIMSDWVAEFYKNRKCKKRNQKRNV